MRIISGKYKGLVLKEYNIVGTRPTMDRVKESLFAMIQNEIKDKICLDLFAGSGSLGIEALSNGALECYFIDTNPIVIKNLKNNLEKIKEKTYVYNLDYMKALEMFKNKSIKFDIIFLDPPYNLKYISKTIETLIKYDLLNDNSYIICEYQDEIINTTLEIFKEKKYGDKYIRIYKY